MTGLKHLLPKPIRHKQIFRQLGLPIAAIAKHIGYSYSYTQNILNGLYTLSPEIEAKLDQLVSLAEAGEVKSDD
jgi:hypothetical protein